jgi:hypothetical protein
MPWRRQAVRQIQQCIRADVSGIRTHCIAMKIEFDLVRNASDSIDRAIELIAWGDQQGEARRLKQAVQAVAHGIELLLKERLRRVHPSLIWENVDRYPSLSARTVTTEGALSRLRTIAGLEVDDADIELLRSLRSTRNAIEHFAWVTTKNKADAIVGCALEFAFHFSRNELDYEYMDYSALKDGLLDQLIQSNGHFAKAVEARKHHSASKEGREPLICSKCRGRAVDPITCACRLCGHWQPDDDEVPF